MNEIFAMLRALSVIKRQLRPRRNTDVVRNKATEEIPVSRNKWEKASARLWPNKPGK